MIHLGEHKNIVNLTGVSTLGGEFLVILEYSERVSVKGDCCMYIRLMKYYYSSFVQKCTAKEDGRIFSCEMQEFRLSIHW